MLKAVFALLLLVIVTGAGLPLPMSGAPVSMETVRFSGKSYVSLADWARNGNLNISWTEREKTVQLVNGSSRLVFTADSRDAQINGVRVWLSDPVVVRGGAAYLSECDWRTALKPVLNPQRDRSRSRIKNIVLDPGHGGTDPGEQDGVHQEKRYTLLLALELAEQLKRAGFKVSLTRTTDTKIELSNRPDIARRRGADLFICLHWNSTGVGRNEVKGAETYALTPVGASSTNAGGEIMDAGSKPGNRNDDQNMLLAYAVQRALRNNLAVEDRGVKRARFAVLREATMPAVLIEGGFMSHPGEAQKIYNPVYRKQMAGAIVRGVLAYQAKTERTR